MIGQETGLAGSSAEQSIPREEVKATQAVAYFASRSGGQINKMKALKLVFFADRFHVRKYGRPTVGDDYFAMKLGPVASVTKDIAEINDFLDDSTKRYVGQYIKPIDHLTVSCVRDPDLSVFSRSDIEALEFALEKFGHLDEFTLSELTHRYPEWLKHAPELAKRSRVSMDYADFFLDPDNAPDDAFQRDPERLRAVKSIFLQDRDADLAL